MNKKIIALIVGVLVIVGIAGSVIFLNSKSDNKENNSTNNSTNNQTQNNTNETNDDGEDNNKISNIKLSKDSKILVVYYSAQGHTSDVAKQIANNLNADIFEIEPKNEYTYEDLDWTDDNSRVSKEHNNESLRNIELKSINVDGWEEYDVVLIGYPIWWKEAAWPVNNFVKGNDFTGKTVIPFCTSASSSLGNSAKLLEELAGTGNWKDGYRFSSNATDADIKSFTDSIK